MRLHHHQSGAHEDQQQAELRHCLSKSIVLRNVTMHGRMPLPKDVTFVTFDVYGTLIDWESGAYDAFAKEAERDGYTLAREELIPLFLEIQKEIKGGSYELYA